MLKKILLLSLLLALALPLQVKADEVVAGNESSIKLSDIPALKQGFAYSLQDSNFNYMSTLEVLNGGVFGSAWKGLTLEAGYAGRAQNTGDKIVAVLSYNLLSLKNYLDIPVLKYVEFNPGIWAGVGRVTGSNEYDWGVSATLVNIKF